MPEQLPAWLQAGAALLQASVAIALYKITRQYVELTGRLARSSEAQIELMRADRDRDQAAGLHRLAALAQSMLYRLMELPDVTITGRADVDRRLRNATLPTPQEIQDLRQLAAGVGPAVAQVGHGAADNIAAIVRAVHEVQSTNPAMGYDYKRFDWQAWSRHLSAAKEALARLSGAGR